MEEYTKPESETRNDRVERLARARGAVVNGRLTSFEVRMIIIGLFVPER